MGFIALVERLYRASLNLYPAPYRREYGAAMAQVFRDMSRTAYQNRGMIGLVGWWSVTLLDLIRTVYEQQQATVIAPSTLIRSNVAALLSLSLCLPIVMAVLGIEPPFIHLLMEDSSRPTTLGRIVMLGMLFSLPAAFVINLLAMVSRSPAENRSSFRPTPAHSLIGLVLLGLMFSTSAPMVLRELRPFVSPLGSNAGLSQILFCLGLLALPVAFLLNRLPHFGRRQARNTLAFQPSSINLIIGAAILLTILMIVSAITLETLACSSGVPNCD